MGGSSVPSSTQSTTQVQVPDWVASQVQANIAKSNTLAAQTYQAPDLPTVAPLSSDQNAAIAGVRANTGSTTPQFNSAISGLTDFPASVNALLDPNLGAQESDTTANLLRQGALNREGVTAAATGAGALGGTREGVALGMVDSNTQQTIASTIGQMSGADYSNATGDAFTEMMQTGSLASAGQIANLRALAAESQAGGQEQTLTQAGYEDALSQWQQQQNWPYEQLAIDQSALAGSPYGSTVTSQQPYNSNTLASALGLTASAIPIASTLANWAGLGAASGPLSGLATSAFDGITSLGVAGTTGGAGTGLLTSAGLFTPLASGAGGTAAAGGAAKGGADLAAAAPALALAA